MSTIRSSVSIRSDLITFFLLSYLLSWVIWISAALASHGVLVFPIPTSLSTLIGVFGPSLAALVLIAYKEGRPGFKSLGQRLTYWRVGIGWYLFALGWPTVFLLIENWIAMLFGGPAPDYSHPPIFDVSPLPSEAGIVGSIILVLIVFVQQFLLGSAMGEELGWRGYALPRLQTRFNALVASLILGLLWGIWHLPLFFTQGDPRTSMSFGWFLPGIILASIIYTWLYNNTQESLLLVLLYHASTAFSGLFIASTSTTPLIGLALNLIFVLLIIIVWPKRLTSKQGFAHAQNTVPPAWH